MSNFDDKYQIKIVKRADYYRGTYVINGQSYRLDYQTKEEVLKNIEIDIRMIAGERRDSTTVIGRPKGTKNYRGRPFNEKDIKRIFNNISAAVVGSAIASRSAMLDGLADDLLKKVVKKAKYDEYLGNLTASYTATIVQKRQVVDTILFAKHVNYGAIHRGPKGGEYVLRRHSKHHSPASKRTPNRRKIKNKKTNMLEARDVRYIKKWESRRYGYEPALSYRGLTIYPGKISRGDGRIQTGVLITNSAPYASAVHRTPGRKVLENSIARSYASSGWGAKYEQLFRFASKSVLQRTFKGMRGGKNLHIRNI